MGYGTYSHDAHAAITSSRSAVPDREVFKETQLASPMNPYGVRCRESRDSALHPNSLAIVFALDETGSMGKIPTSIARTELPSFMQQILDLGVEDPQILFMGVGDAPADRSPLQVGQFESEPQLMDQWLTSIHLEGGGGGSGEESYELAAYFIARHTAMDCWDKRRQKGYVFITGDEKPYPRVSQAQVRTLIGDLSESIQTEDVFRELREKFHVFFILPNNSNSGLAVARWQELLGDHAIQLQSQPGHDDVCLTAAAIVALNEGKVRDLVALAAQYESQGISRERVGAMVRALTSFAATLDRDGADAPRLEKSSSERRADRRADRAMR